MAVNVTMLATEAPAVIWLEDGSSLTADPQQEKQFQLPSGSFCTISSTAGSNEDGEHPPSPEDRAIAFAEKMIAFFQGLRRKAQEEICQAQNPTAAPV